MIKSGKIVKRKKGIIYKLLYYFLSTVQQLSLAYKQDILSLVGYVYEKKSDWCRTGTIRQYE